MGPGPMGPGPLNGPRTRAQMGPGPNGPRAQWARAQPGPNGRGPMVPGPNVGGIFWAGFRKGGLSLFFDLVDASARNLVATTLHMSSTPAVYKFRWRKLMGVLTVTDSN